ncbi:BA75_02357T0 [Komagataella pastoris]|uniref:BA75_02357T0 n=1 Tax=Komagataella pastoris TaxID=4922 RepID=A0A1B2JBG2_PICPA|nr:BA75_02357T0 [Komagataella pastoris]
MDSIVITDEFSNLLYQYLWNPSSISFGGLMVRLKLTSFQSENGFYIECDKKYIIKYPRNGIIVWLVCRKNDPFVYALFVDTFIKVLEEYIGKPTPARIKSHSDTISLLLLDMADGGFPFIIDDNQIKDLMPNKSIMDKILSSTKQLTKTANNSLNRNVAFNTFANQPSMWSRSNYPIPWRRSKVYHTNNEILIDIVEELTMITLAQNATKDDSNSSAFYNSSVRHSKRTPLVSKITGKILVNSHLSGIPHVNLRLNLKNNQLSCPSFHRAVDIPRWNSASGLISFVPPDGVTTLVSYVTDLNRHQDFVNVQYGFFQGKQSNEFEIQLTTLSSSRVIVIENLKLEIHLPKECESSVKVLRCTHGDLQLSRKNRYYEWIFAKEVPTGITATFRGCLVDSSDPVVGKLRPNYLQLSYETKHSLLTGLEVQSIEIEKIEGLSNQVKPYKGAKYVSRVTHLIR